MQLQLASQASVVVAAHDVVMLAPRDGALLAWLALEGATPRKQIAALLWPDSDPDTARNALRQRLFELRRRVGSPLVKGTAVLALTDDVSHDLVDANTVLGDSQHEYSPEFAAWLARQRERRAERMQRALADLVDLAEQSGHYVDALNHAQELLALQPLSEDAHRRIMRLQYLRGDRAEALLAFERCERVLKDELGVRPSADTLLLLATIESSCCAVAVRPSDPVPASLVRPPRLVGRRREFDALAGAWSAHRVVGLVGEAGMGKTRLLQAFDGANPGVVRVAGRPGDAGVPFATLARLLRAVVARHGNGPPADLPASVRTEIARIVPELEMAARPYVVPGRRLVLQAAVAAFLAGHRGLTGLVIDDLHFADEGSLEMLAALLDDAEADGSRPLRWVLAYRPAEASTPLRCLHDNLVDEARLVVVPIAPLDEPSLAELVDSLTLPGVDGRALAAGLFRRTGGNPLFVLETLKQAWVDGVLDDLAQPGQIPRPASVSRLIERRIARLSPDALALARLASIAEVDFSVELAEHVLAQPAMQLSTAWSELESAQVFKEGSFAHDLVYEVTRASVPGEIARHTHAAVARWLEARRGEPERIAAHWIAAGADERAIGPLREAARRNAERTCLAEARACLERAAALCGAAGRPRDEFAVLFELHRNYIVDDPGDAHERLVQRLHDLASDETERLDAAWARHNLRRFRQTTSPITQIEADFARAEALGDPRVLAAYVTMLTDGFITLNRPDDAAALVQRHQALFEQSARRELPDLHGHLSAIFGEQDRFAEALHHAARAAALYRDASEPGELMVVLCNQTRVLRSQGRMVAAHELFERIDRWHAADAPNPRAWLVSRVGAAEVRRALGRHGEALQALEHPVAEMQRCLGPLYAAALLARARIWLDLGQHARAVQTLAAIDRQDAELPDWLRAQCGLFEAQLLARMGDAEGRTDPGDRARALLEAAARMAPRHCRRLAWLECELQRAAWLDPDNGAALAEHLALVAAHHGLAGHALQARLHEASQRLAAGQVEAALGAVRQAQAWQQHRFADTDHAEPVHPGGGSPAEQDLIVARVLLAARRPEAAGLLAAAVARLQSASTLCVPAAFHDSYLQRNPVHRGLLALVHGGTAPSPG